MFTPLDWRNGADYSDETYESFHNTFETYDTFGKFLKIFFIVIACSLAICLIIWQWENITEICNRLYNFIMSKQKIKEIVIAIALGVPFIITLSIPYIIYMRHKNK